METMNNRKVKSTDQRKVKINARTKNVRNVKTEQLYDQEIYSEFDVEYTYSEQTQD